ncbi:DUF6232 family protein [Actinoplanes oblitus]|uniref:DUF6232 family protein n=2 Tax=Actinoplanes oblitus TaxID=3040509 RepID=A0ABY8W7J1_9ACTN|nr:DUF6232 family protein [Actinoplanes oblitus]
MSDMELYRAPYRWGLMTLVDIAITVALYAFMFTFLQLISTTPGASLALGAVLALSYLATFMFFARSRRWHISVSCSGRRLLIFSTRSRARQRRVGEAIDRAMRLIDEDACVGS